LENTLGKIISRASDFNSIMVSRALSLLEELINLEIEIDESELSDEEKGKLKTLLTRLRESIYSEVFNSKE
jgi:hypothetical protein